MFAKFTFFTHYSAILLEKNIWLVLQNSKNYFYNFTLLQTYPRRRVINNTSLNKICLLKYLLPLNTLFSKNWGTFGVHFKITFK